jgi:hypothetical protein
MGAKLGFNLVIVISVGQRCLGAVDDLGGYQVRQFAMEIPMAKQRSAPARKFEVWQPRPSDGLLVASIWSMTIVSVAGFIR